MYRDGSRDGQVLSTGATKSPAQQADEAAKTNAAEERAAKLEAELRATREALARAEAQAQQVRRHKRKRPAVLRGTTRKMSSPLGDVFVTINEDGENTPFEVFATLGKAGSIAMADVEAIGRLISLALRFGVPVNEVHTQLRGISSDRAVGFGVEQGALGAGRDRAGHRAAGAGEGRDPAGADPGGDDSRGGGGGGAGHGLAASAAFQRLQPGARRSSAPARSAPASSSSPRGA